MFLPRPDTRQAHQTQSLRTAVDRQKATKDINSRSWSRARLLSYEALELYQSEFPRTEIGKGKSN